MPSAERPDFPESAASLRWRLDESQRWAQVLDSQVQVLERERQKLAAVVGHGDLGFLVVDPELKVTWANEFFARHVGRVPDSRRLIGLGCNRALCHKDLACDRCPVAAAVESQSVAHHELSLDVDDLSHLFYVTAIPMLSPKGHVEQTMVMVQDVSDLEALRRSERMLRDSERRLRMIVGQMPAVMWSTDLELRFTSVVGSALSDLGLEPDALIGKTVYEHLGARASQSVVIAAHARAMSGESVSFESETNGRVLEAYLEPLLGEDRRIVGCVGLALDMTERRQTELAGRLSEARKHAILQTALDAIVSFDHESRITEFNPAAEALFGYTWEEAMGRPLADVLIPPRLRDAHRDEFARNLAAGETHAIGRRIETTAMRKDGSEVPVELAIIRIALDGPPAFTGFIRDLTDRKQAEEALKERDEQLRQSQKMEAIGILAGGVAHDFNNILTAIAGYAALLQRGEQSVETVKKAAAVMEAASKRGAALTQQLLGFARKGKNQTVPVDLGAVLDEVVRLLQRTIEKEILVHRAPSTPNLSVIGDPGQIQQVILNLSVNARDAMPDGGELTLNIGAVELGADEYVRLSVTDTGSGIPDDVRDRIFEPFFTTKDIGKGTGMGLAMVYGIVQNHGGLINVLSAVGMGTTFEILLPRGPDIDRAGVVELGAQAHGGTGRILVVEDEECVREVAVDLLRELGYDVSTASDGLEAIDHFAQFHHEIDAVLLDLAMPNMGGRECFRALKEINPGVRAVLCTGYGFNVATQQLLDEGMVAIVAKPYELEKLSEAIALAVNGGCPADV